MVGLDKWRSGVFSGKIREAEYESSYWTAIVHETGVAPTAEIARGDDGLFSAGANYEVAANVGSVQRVLGIIMAFQLHRGMCKAAMGDSYTADALHRCTAHGSKEGRAFVHRLLRMDMSVSLRYFLSETTGEKGLDASALLEYFAPLAAFLAKQNKGQLCGWSSAAHTSSEALGVAGTHV